MNADVQSLIDDARPRLETVLHEELVRHIEKLQSNGEKVDGYAILPGDCQTTIDAPPSIWVRYNRKLDLAEEDRNNPETIYCPDEWENDECDGFEETNAQFKVLYTRLTHDFATDDQSIYDFAHKVILKCLARLRDEHVVDQETYLVIWISDSYDPIITESTIALNPPHIVDACRTAEMLDERDE